MVWRYGTHQLSETDVAALAIGDFQAQTVQVLRAAELSKHLLLLEAVRRTIWRRPNYEGARLVEKASRTLDEVQDRAPEVVAEILGLPHFGLWVARCLFHLRSRTRQELGPAWQREIGHLATFAAASALRIGYPFELIVPAQHGRVVLPTLGTALVGRPKSSVWAQIRLDRRGAVITSPSRSVSLPTCERTKTQSNNPGWQPAVELEAETDGVRLKVIFETEDPFLRLLSPAAVKPSLPVKAIWQQRMEDAWQILVGHDRRAASGLASVLTTLVPLREPESGDLISATSGWAWGAIAMSLPADASLAAETLDHEFHHLMLAAVEDLVPLVSEGDHGLYYAPWREDPRPASALLQGIYAHLGVAKFWRQRRRAESPPYQLRSEVKFIRSCRAALNAARTLADADVLTITGSDLISGMLEQLGSWKCERVSHVADSTEVEMSFEHHLRWRLAHCQPNVSAIDALAYAWLGDRNWPFSGPPPPSEVTPYYRRLTSDLSKLLDLRYCEPLRFAQLMEDEDSVHPCDVTLLTGDYAKAKDGYLQLISANGDRGAWVGLLLARYGLAGEMEAVADRPEIAVGAYEKIQALTGLPPDAEGLIAWLNEVLSSA